MYVAYFELSHHISGFRPEDSIVNQLLAISDKIHHAKDNKYEVKMFFLDVAKAFA